MPQAASSWQPGRRVLLRDLRPPLAPADSFSSSKPCRSRRPRSGTPFAVEVDGTLFGLVRECHGEYPEGEEQDDWAEFYPNRLGFSAPWDGLYDT